MMFNTKVQALVTTPAVIVCVVVLLTAIGVQWHQVEDEMLPLKTSNTPTLSEPPSPYSGLEKVFDEERVWRAPDIEFMPASASDEYQVSDPTLLPAVEWLDQPSNPRERAMGARFRNFLPYDLAMYFDDGSEEGVYSGSLQAYGGFSATNTYTGHVFIFRNKHTGEFVERLEMRDDKHLMIIGPEEGDEATFNSKAYQDALREQDFMDEYFKETGLPWLSYYPRNKPVVNMWPADFVGQVHKVRSYVGYFKSETEQSNEPVDLLIRVVSVRPRVIVIENLLSPFEIEHIMELGKNVLRRSSVGNGDDGFESNTRTSENGWLSRKKSHVLNTIYYRYADVLLMSQGQMTEGGHGNIEQLQFVRYLKGQKYDNHHDFGNNGTPQQRFSTLLTYLRTPEIGGATSFPKAFDGKGIMIKPPPGSAALFYSMLPDGNGDDLSLHSGMAVKKGTKFVCNLWSWDDKYGV